MSDAVPGAIGDLPDWRDVIASEDAWLLPAYRTGGLFFALPKRVCLARNADRSPDFFLEFVSDRNAAGEDQALFASLHMGLECPGLRTDALRSTRLSPAEAAVVPVSFSAGATWHFEAGDCRVAAPFAWDGARRATLDARIPARAGDLLYAQLEAGAITAARVAVECQVAGVLPRLDTIALFDAGALLAHLRGLDPGAPSLAFDRLVSWLKAPPPELLRFEGGDLTGSAHRRAFTLAGWLTHHFGGPAPCRRIADGPQIALRAPEEAGGPTRWDLRTPLPTGVPRFLDLDPFTPIIEAGGRNRVTAFTRVGPLPEDHLTLNVAVASGFPENIRNCDAVDVTLCVDREQARSGLTTAHSVRLYPGGRRSRTVALAFRRGGLKAYRARLQLVVDDAVLELPWFAGPGSYLHLGPDDLPLSLVTVRAAPPLLQQARLAVAIPGTAHQAEIVPEAPSVSFLLPPGGAERLMVSAQDPAAERPAITLDLPGASVELDCDSFPQFGPQTTQIRVAFAGGLAAARFAFLPETAQEPIVLDFTPARSSTTFGYFADRIFRNRYRVRRVFEEDADGGWSDYQLPGRDLTLSAHPERASRTSYHV